MAGRYRPRDHYARMAKKEGRAARSVYKLEELDRRWKIVRRGDRVLDLGCAPGSWTQYAAERVQSEGMVFGIDLKPVEIGLPSHAQTRVGDVSELLEVSTPESGPLSKPFDAVLSDMAPATTGHRVTDTTRSVGLAEIALEIASVRLRSGGRVVVKVLEGGEIQALALDMKKNYDRVERARPQATRKSSTEIFLVGLGKK